MARRCRQPKPAVSCQSTLINVNIDAAAMQQRPPRLRVLRPGASQRRPPLRDLAIVAALLDVAKREGVSRIRPPATSSAALAAGLPDNPIATVPARPRIRPRAVSTHGAWRSREADRSPHTTNPPRMRRSPDPWASVSPGAAAGRKQPGGRLLLSCRMSLLRPDQRRLAICQVWNGHRRHIDEQRCHFAHVLSSAGRL